MVNRTQIYIKTFQVKRLDFFFFFFGKDCLPNTILISSLMYFCALGAVV